MHRMLAIAAGVLLAASTAFAEDHHHGGGGGGGGGGGSHGGPPSHGGAPSGYHGEHFHGPSGGFSAPRGGPPGGGSGYRNFHGSSGFNGPSNVERFHGDRGFAPRGEMPSRADSFHGDRGFSSRDRMPSRDFRGVPPGFHGGWPHGSAAPSRVGFSHGFGGRGHDMGRFHGRDFAHFSGEDRDRWEHGRWRHDWHNGHFGWWWYADDDWFFYPQPTYPYPEYVGSADYYDYYDENGAQPYYWYYCEDPPGYYPYVQQCEGPWEPVPPNGGYDDQ